MDDQAPPTIVVVGDINADLSFALPAFPREGHDTQVAGLHWGSGGGGLNIAVGLAGLGARARLLGRVGGDPAAEVALGAARRAGVDLSLLQVDPQVPTGLCGVMVSPGGERSFLSFRGANPGLDPAAIDRAALEGCALLLISGYALLDGPQQAATLKAIGVATAAGIPCGVDLCLPAISAARRVIDDIVGQLWLLTLNAGELAALLPGQSVAQALDHLIDAGTRTVAIKRGPLGCIAAQGATRVELLPPVVSAIDTNACGDAFAAGFAWALLRGSALGDCAALGNLTGALTATCAGAAEAIPTYAKIREQAGPQLRHLLL